MRFLFLLGALLVLFAEVAYPQGEDYQGKRGKYGFLQGKRGKHGFLQDLFGNEDNQATSGFCGHCHPDSDEDYQGKRGKHGFGLYQGKRGKHGFLQGKRGKHGFIHDTDTGSTVCSTDSDCSDGLCCSPYASDIMYASGTCGRCNEDNPDDDYQGKRGKHGFLQGKRGKHGFIHDTDTGSTVCSTDSDCGDG